jgi:hypothetical protein
VLLEGLARLPAGSLERLHDDLGKLLEGIDADESSA